MGEIEITSDNFGDYFFDVRRHTPKPGQAMARFTAMADFVDDGPPYLKRDIVNLLVNVKGGGNSAPKLFQKVGGSTEEEAVRVCLAMGQDLAEGMTEKEVLEKPYRFQCELFYYCQSEYIPDDPHWQHIKLIDAKKFLEDFDLNTPED